jgi:hypothetical protein
LYADDVILFINPTSDDLLAVMDILELFGSTSGFLRTSVRVSSLRSNAKISTSLPLRRSLGALFSIFRVPTWVFSIDARLTLEKHILYVASLLLVWLFNVMAKLHRGFLVVYKEEATRGKA